MKRKWMLAITAALTAAVIGAGPAAAATLYAGDTEKYSVAFKAEGAERYVMQFAGRTHCYYTEPHEDVGGGGFSAFPAPRLMRKRPQGFAAGEISGDGYGLAEARIRANFSDNEVTGEYSYDESEESFHCDTGFAGRPFEASRYVRIGSKTASAPARGEKRVYYGSRGPIEIFLRKIGKEAGGIRGTFVPRCAVGRRKKTPTEPALFPRPAFAKLGEKGKFRRGIVQEGRMRSGAGFKETISITGRVKPLAVIGAYLRVRTMKASGQKCVTGPVPFRAVRYLHLGEALMGER